MLILMRIMKWPLDDAVEFALTLADAVLVAFRRPMSLTGSNGFALWVGLLL